MARRRRRKKEDPRAVVTLALLFGLFYSGISGAWGLFAVLVLLLVGAVVLLVAQARAKRTRALALRDLQALTPRELELHVAQVLNALPGWRAEATRGSADQGADVIATGPGGAKVAVQVKKYSNPVGNKAVQEIVASKAFYRCAHAVVVTSGPGYTRAARELARANGVPLWGPDDLFRLQALAAQKQAPPRDLLPA
ncbi:hypothetical protein Dcar01_03661 [Deinococcus carri]|uniref:Restriction endonuclease type IV Mrr domain-containing protein n=1 Tax=Deinococcus carri TaxID=1211323 RepID=A0ABP9WF74_9DEIO